MIISIQQSGDGKRRTSFGKWSMTTMIFLVFLAFFPKSTSAASVSDIIGGWRGLSSDSVSATEAAPQGDTYSIAPLIQDEESAYFISDAGGATTEIFNQQSKSLGMNLAGSPGSWLRVMEDYEAQSDGTVRVSVHVTSLDANDNPEPWVDESQSGNGFVSWRVDIGTEAGGSNPIDLSSSFTVRSSGVQVYDSAGVLLSDFDLYDDTSTSTSLSGLAIIGIGGDDIAGYDLATVTLYWVIELDSIGTGFQVSGGQTGAWYDPTHDGEGFVLQIVNDTTAVVYWFTYDTNGNQYWMIGVGQIQGSRITFSELLTTSGGRFGPDFDPDDVIYQTWGTLELNFSDCGNATATYSGPPSFGSGVLNVVRLSSVWGLNCNGSSTQLNAGGVGFLSPGFSGSWYDFSHDGEGFTIEILNETTALIYWFTYDTNGDQAWMLAIGEIQGASIIASEVLITSGGRFGPGFDPADVVLQQWGAAAFTFGSCGNGELGGAIRYLPPANFGPESTQFLNRLVASSQLDCAFLSDTYRISGSVSVAENVFVDGDTNNPNMVEQPNDLENPAQQLVPPARVAGFATAEPTGQQGDRFESQTDEWDVYILALREGDGVALTVSDWMQSNPDENDLDLYLANVNDPETLIDSSLTTNQLEIVTAPSDGNYFVVVGAYSGTSNYLLQSGQQLQASTSTIDASSDFVADQLMAGLIDLNSLASQTEKSDYLNRIQRVEQKNFLTRISDSPAGDVLYDLSSTPASGLLPHPLTLAGIGSIAPEQWAVIRVAKSLGADADFRYAEPNYILKPTVTPNDPAYEAQWHYDIIRLPSAWNVTTGNNDVIIAVLDTGVYNHFDLAANVDYSLGYDFIQDPFNAGDGDGLDSDARDPGDLFPGPGGYTSHGTHVAGTIAARTNNNAGVSGVNWNATIMPVRVLGTSSGTCWSTNEGLKWAGRISNASGQLPAKRADIVNLSLGGYTPCSAVQSSINALNSRGIVVIAAAGNDSTSTPFYPASFANVVSVSATTISDDLSYYSNYGSTLDLAAPGGDVSVDLNEDSYKDGILSNAMFIESGSNVIQTGYRFLQGTSMAAPHVAGVAGLMKSVYPDMGPEEFQSAISSGSITTDLAQNGASTKDPQFGYGRIDALKAVQWAANASSGQSTDAFVTSSAATLNFASNLQTIDLMLEKSGEGNLSVSSLGASDSWISVSENNVNSSGFGSYRVRVNRSGLIDGQYAGWIGFQDSNGSQLLISVLMRRGQSVSGNAGYLEAILLDEWTLQTIKGQALFQNGNSVDVVLNNNVPGNYYLVVSTDLDNDRFLCDAGELCEIYPSNGSIDSISIIDRNVNLGPFQVTFPTTSVSTSSNQDNSEFGLSRDGIRIPH